MRNPYDVLGITSSASIEEVKSAYRRISAQIQSGSYSQQEAEKMMEEINQAYDTIILYSSENGSNNYDTHSKFSSNLGEVREKIRNKNFDSAEIQLNAIPSLQRNAEWYFLMGTIFNKRGWFEEAKKHYTIACQMDPSNTEYREAFNSISSSSANGYRSAKRQEYNKGDSSACCNLCSALICTDCICDCCCGNSRGCC